MADHPSHEIFQLIHSLTLGEWKTLLDDVSKSHSSNVPEGQEPIAIQLIRFLQTQERYDDDAAKKKLGYEDRKLGTWRGLKRDAIVLMLRAIERARSNKTRRTELQKAPTTIKKLIEKELWGKARSMATKSLKDAEELEEFELAIQLINLLQFIVPITVTDLKIQKELELLREKRKDARKKLQNIEVYQDALFQVNGYAKKKDKNAIRRILDSALLTSPELYSIRAETRYHQLNRRCTFFHGKQKLHREAIDYCIQFSEPLIGNVELHEVFDLYITSLSKFATAQIGEKNFIDAELSLNKLRQASKIKDLAPFQHTAIKARLLLLNVVMARFKFDNDGFLTCVNEIENWFVEKRGYIDENSKNRLGLACVDGLFIFSQFSLCAKWIMRIRENEPSHFRPQITSAAWMIYPIIRYELGDWDIIQSQLTGTRDYLEQFEPENEYFQTLMEFWERTAKTKGDLGREEFSSLHTKLQILRLQPEYAMLETYFDYSLWLESKIKNIPFSSLLQQQ